MSSSQNGSTSQCKHVNARPIPAPTQGVHDNISSKVSTRKTKGSIKKEESKYNDTYDESLPLIDSQHINDHDVLLGRNSNCYNHRGNKKFRFLTNQNVERFAAATLRTDKANVVSSIIEAIHSNGGRFLKQESRSKKWYVVSSNKTRSKTSHALRDVMAQQSKAQHRPKRNEKSSARYEGHTQLSNGILPEIPLRPAGGLLKQSASLVNNCSSGESIVSDSAIDEYNEATLASLNFDER